MNLKSLKIFVRVCELGSLTKASATLGITQPSLSRAIIALESEFGGALFYRTGRGVSLTELGGAALPRARSLIAHAEEITSDMRDLGRSPTGVVSLGILPSMATPLASRLFEEARHLFPGIQLRIYEGFSEQIEHWVATGHVDIGVLSRYRASRAGRDEVLLDSGLMLVSSLRKGSQLKEIDFKRLEGLPMVLPISPNGLRLLVDETANRLGVKLDVVLEADSLGVQKDIVRNHGCFTILSPQAVFSEVSSRELSASHIINPVLARQAILTSTSSRPISRGAREVATLIKSIVVSLSDEWGRPDV